MVGCVSVVGLVSPIRGEGVIQLYHETLRRGGLRRETLFIYTRRVGVLDRLMILSLLLSLLTRAQLDAITET